ncbi:MAG: osmoprotectant transport system permease protein [Clostridiales bacterium]|jgi:osmoprotectant transport system permease protein|nr:osmoprotectant transport system permease protein [Clostridiales bacterium]MDK2933254.1 osmoprotectant transport system permease protein [Clostridiales bacterium]
MEKILITVVDHLQIAATGVLIAVLVGITMGIVLTRYKPIAGFVMSVTDIIQTIPTLALLSILMIMFGLGNATVIIGLFLYSLLPIIRNTYVGILSVDEGLIEAGLGMGMTKTQLLFKVELPIALPIILSGIRIAFITALGITTIGVLIGAGGLGHFIWRGIQMQNTRMILSGAIPVSILAVGADLLLGFLENKLVKRAKRA